MCDRDFTQMLVGPQSALLNGVGNAAQRASAVSASDKVLLLVTGSKPTLAAPSLRRSTYITPQFPEGYRTY